MDLKDIQEKLKELRDRIKAEGCISETSEEELKSLLNNTVISAHDQLATIQSKLGTAMAMRATNDNILTPDQKKRLSIVEKTGTGSNAVH